MQSTTERRQAILQCLCRRRHETMANLMIEFRASRSTIRRDIEVLSISYPLITLKGTGGGVRVMDGYSLGMKYMTEEQSELLKKLAANLSGEEKLVMNSILNTFSRPNCAI